MRRKVLRSLELWGGHKAFSDILDLQQIGRPISRAPFCFPLTAHGYFFVATSLASRLFCLAAAFLCTMFFCAARSRSLTASA